MRWPVKPTHRYLDLIEATLRLALRESLPLAPLDPQPIAGLLPLLAGQTFQGIGSLDFVDGAGHRRPAYRGLAMRHLGQHATPSGPTVIRGFIAQHHPAIEMFSRDVSPLAASVASEVLAVIFDAGAIVNASAATPEAREIAARCFRRLIGQQQPDGTFLARGASDNPEPLWYAELALLHAVHVYAIDLQDRGAREAAARAAGYLAAEVQPDHASSHPWGIAALLESANGIALADTMLHVAGVQEPTSMDAVSLLLLDDALRCGRVAERG